VDYNSDNVLLSDEDIEETFDSIIIKRKNERNVFDKRKLPVLRMKETKSALSCPRCGEVHKMEECGIKIHDNVFDKRREQFTSNHYGYDRYHKNK
jgi:hypothetical protein